MGIAMVSEGSFNLQRSAPRHCSQCVGQVHTKDLRDASHVTLQGDQEAGGLIPRPAKTRLGTRGFWNTTQGTSQQRMASKLLEKYANRNRFHNSNGVQLDLNPFVHIRYTMGQLKKKAALLPNRRRDEGPSSFTTSSQIIGCFKAQHLGCIKEAHVHPDGATEGRFPQSQADALLVFQSPSGHSKLKKCTIYPLVN